MRQMTLYGVSSAPCARTKVESYTFHDLRHEALSRLAERGNFSILELTAISGQKMLQMLKRFMHLQAAKLVDKLARAPR